MKHHACLKCQDAERRATEALGLLNDAQGELIDLRTANAGLLVALEASQLEVRKLNAYLNCSGDVT